MDRPPSLGPRPVQGPQVFCQVCGRAKPTLKAARADGWLVERWRVDPALFIVRCYAHISEWSLRVSAAGRTKAWRQAAQEGRRRAQEGPAPIPPEAQPVALDGPPGLPGDESVDYGPWAEEERDGRSG